ncbi:hypothetical protein Q7C36_007441 [Tachysurus vachellii]|uniref:Uncharacterized protein n=1 Tax=Tachysurus vachellii TaxID=175792 RepID=A0AA88SXB6_TACVA|nr:hypothetical protein Q7C36_007441 [Tachysurus vachellii]
MLELAAHLWSFSELSQAAASPVRTGAALAERCSGVEFVVTLPQHLVGHTARSPRSSRAYAFHRCEKYQRYLWQASAGKALPLFSK